MGIFYPSLLALEETSALPRPWFVFTIHFLFIIVDFHALVGVCAGLVLNQLFMNSCKIKSSDLFKV